MSKNPIYGKTNPSPHEYAEMPIKRFASVIGLHDQKEQEYRELHANVWPEIIESLKNSNIQNYSIHVHTLDHKRYLFSYFEYIGNDFRTDMNKIENNPDTKRWWSFTDPCQRQLPCRPKGGNWSPMEMVFMME